MNELTKEQHSVVKTECYRCNYCQRFFKNEEDAYNCLLKHITSDYRCSMWENGRSLGYICYMTHFSLNPEESEIAYKIYKNIKIHLKPWGEPSAWDLNYNPWHNTFTYGRYCENSIQETIKRIIEQKIELKEIE